MIGIMDSEHVLTVLTDRPLGGSSMQSGGIELMINRKTTNCDKGGLEENLEVTGEVTVSFLLQIAKR